MGRIIIFAALALGLPFAATLADDTPSSKADPALVEFFEGKVRPVLEAHCIQCHGASKQKAGLRLDSRAALLKGGDSGQAIEPGRPEGSRLIEAVNHSADLQMPPKGKLKEAEVAALSRWVRDGAVWPEATAEVRPTNLVASGKISPEERAFWAFRPVENPPIPPVKDASWPKGTLDRFVLNPLESKGLWSSPPAGQANLDPPGDLRPDRPAADPRGSRGVRGRRVARSVRQGRRPPAG